MRPTPRPARLRAFTRLIPAVAALTLLGACGTPPPAAVPASTPGGAASSPTGPRPAATTPTPTASPTPTAAPTTRASGTNHSSAAAAYTYSSAEVHDWLHGRKEQAPTYPKREKVAFLTFDDGPTNTTPKVLDALKAHGVHASFFVIGTHGLATYDKEILNRMIAEGHAICIHSWSHNMKQLYPGHRANAHVIVADHQKMVDGVKAVVGQDFNAHCHRYPGGHGWKNMEPADRALRERGAYWLDWNSENGDGRNSAPGSGEGRAALALSTLTSKPGVAMVLMHDYRDNQATVDGIGPIVERLKADGYAFGVLD
ncbi:polysaccharide deacetylase family protein [Mariniluteicoccus flavus]